MCAAWSSRAWALALAGGTTVQERLKRPVCFETPSARATLRESDAFSARASSRTANATLGPLTGPRYILHVLEGVMEAARRACPLPQEP